MGLLCRIWIMYAKECERLQAMGGPMTKSELIERMSGQQPNIPVKTIETAVREIIEILSTKLEKGERVEIRGFGSFSLHYRPPRIGRNPKTGEKIALEARQVPHFKPGRRLRDRVNIRS